MRKHVSAYGHLNPNSLSIPGCSLGGSIWLETLEMWADEVLDTRVEGAAAINIKPHLLIDISRD
jgi:hypothetical protein